MVFLRSEFYWRQQGKTVDNDGNSTEKGSKSSTMNLKPENSSWNYMGLTRTRDPGDPASTPKTDTAKESQIKDRPLSWSFLRRSPSQSESSGTALVVYIVPFSCLIL